MKPLTLVYVQGLTLKVNHWPQARQKKYQNNFRPVKADISTGPTGAVNIQGHSCEQVFPQECPITLKKTKEKHPTMD